MSTFKLSKEAWEKIGRQASWLVEAADKGGIHSYIKKIQKKKTGQEFYTLVIYGNTIPIKDFLGKPKRGAKNTGGEKLYFNYFGGSWSRIIPDSFVEEVLTGKATDDPKEQQRVASFKKAIERLQQGFDVEGGLLRIDLSSIYDQASYENVIDVAPQSEPSGAQKEIKDQTGKAAKRAEKLEVLNRFVDAEIIRISKMTDEATQSTFIKSFLEFSAKFYTYSFRNQMLIWIQKPQATMVANKADWHKKFGRVVVDFGDPISVVVPFPGRAKPEQITEWQSKGMSDKEINNRSSYTTFGAGPVYDISSTRPDPGWTDEHGNGPYEQTDWRQDSNETIEEIEVLVNATAEWAGGNGIDVGYEEMGGDLGGYSSGGSIRINDKYDGINKFSTMVHECAHEVLHWERGKGKNVRSKMGQSEGKMAKEIDAESTAFIVLQHYGFETADTPNYLALWRATGDDIAARRQNISASVKMIIQGIDDNVKNVELAEDQVDELMEQEIDEHGVDMEKKEVVDEVEQPLATPQVEEADPKENMEDEIVSGSNDDPMLKIAKSVISNKPKNDLRGNIYGNLGLCE